MQVKLSKVKLATIWWRDAFAHPTDESNGEGVPNSLLCLSSGIVLEQNEEAIKIATDLFDIQTGQESQTFRGISVIPMEFIQKVIFSTLEIYDKPAVKAKRKKK